ncbi:MAG: multifunctional CCA addition/repair protein [Magnetococcales bacterium]|nr:multifunctional CCA addition/repair protein [Magnetococcales bacterium]
MKSYCVGGAVRDALLGLPVHDRDWVVVGAIPELLLSRGFKRVGADFPVFLHPESGEEYALARTERKKGSGYHGFATNAGPEVTLEQDLGRRDLTINAMALAEGGELIDPFGGQEDLKRRRLRHVGAAFAEDPLRVLRVARLFARLAPLGFTIDPETRELMATLARSGELSTLTAERVWGESLKALATPEPSRYFAALRSCEALAPVFPELAALIGQSQPPQFHPEGDAWQHSLLALEQASRMSDRCEIRFAALVHDLGKGITPPELLPHHWGHDRAGGEVVSGLCDRLRVPNNYRKLAILSACHHHQGHAILEMRAGTIVKWLLRLDGFRNPDRFLGFLTVCRADAMGRGGSEGGGGYPQAVLWRRCLNAASGVDTAKIAAAGYHGPAFGLVLRQERVNRVKGVLGAWREKPDPGLEPERVPRVVGGA